jgi:dihydrolipoamide dehydrogenase
LSESPNIDYYHAVAEFVDRYTLQVRGETIRSKMILLSIGSKPIIPPIKGLNEVGYKTSDTILSETTLNSANKSSVDIVVTEKLDSRTVVVRR